MSAKTWVAGTVLVGGALAGMFAIGGVLSGTDAMAGPEASTQKETVAELARATAAQGVCYGWRLDDGTSQVSRGSSLGETTPVDIEPGRCPRWVEVTASVIWTPESSEAEDSARINVRTSDNLDVGPQVAANLERFGLNENAFIDDPNWAIARAALALPLLTAEAGGAEPAPTPSATPSAAPRALEPAGSDFWRDRLWFLVMAGALVLAAALTALIGVAAGRGQHRRGPVAPSR